MRRLLFKLHSRQWALLVILALFLTACQLPAPAAAETAAFNPELMITAAAQTAAARMTEMALLTPRPPEALLETAMAPTETELPADTPTPTGPVVATIDLATAALAPSEDRAEFVADVTVPDGSTFAPNERFTKTWRFRNSGTSTWTEAYSLVFISGNLMSAPPSVPLPRQVPPGEMVDVSVEMTAPADPGIYQGNWKLRNAAGQIFGAGPTAADPIWVIIAVAVDPNQPTPTGFGRIITSALLRLDNPNVTAPCPYRFVVSAEFTLSQPSTVTFSLEGGSSTGVPINLPMPTIRNLDAGKHTIVYELTFNSALEGWIRLHITAPENIISNQINFSLICQ